MGTEEIVKKTNNYYLSIQEGYMDLIEEQNKIIELNLPLVSTVLCKYKPYTEDQFQIGCIGLINAVRTYKINKGVPFSSYACFCIERAIHMDYRKRMNEIEEQINRNTIIYLDEERLNDDGSIINNHDIIYDEKAEEQLLKYIEENELSFMCDSIIKPVLDKLAPKETKQTKIDGDEWKRYEFLYLMDLVFISSQKQRLTLEQISEKTNVSKQNIRIRHNRVMDELFQRMWEHMTLNYTELLSRLRGNKKVPHKLLVFDPGKTTGWCIFEEGHLTKRGHIVDCYDDKNINVLPLIKILEEEKPDFVLYEDYRVYAHKLERHSFNPIFTIRLIGTIETFCQINVLPTHTQMAVTAKTFVTDQKLKDWGFWESKMKHANDAIRHGCYFLLFFKKGENIIE